MILCGALAEDGADEAALQTQEQAVKEAAEKAAAEKATAEKTAAEKAAAEKESAEKAAQEAASKSVMSAATESSATEGNDTEQKNNSSDDSMDKPSDAPSETSSGNDGDKSNDNSKDTDKDNPSDTPTDTPSDAPTDTPSDHPTDAPMETPMPEPTPTPAPAPTQVSGEIVISAVPSEGLTLDNGAYQVSPKQPASLTLSWSCSCACDGYSLQLSSDKNAVYSNQQSDANYVINLASLQGGNYVFTVEATLDGEVVARGQFAFAAAIADGGKKGGKGGFGGGGHGSGGASSGRSGGSGGAAEEAQGFVITPGTALTGTHTSGTKDMQLYGTLALALSEDAMTALTLDDTALDITLNDGADGFTAYLEDSTLSLSLVNNGGIWRLNGRALRVLSDSGILSLSLETGAGTIVFPTDIALSGEVYARLRAAGYVSSDFEFRVSADGITVSVAGMVYRLEASGGLTPLEGE